MIKNNNSEIMKMYRTEKIKLTVKNYYKRISRSVKNNRINVAIKSTDRVQP